LLKGSALTLRSDSCA